MIEQLLSTPKIKDNQQHQLILHAYNEQITEGNTCNHQLASKETAYENGLIGVQADRQRRFSTFLVHKFKGDREVVPRQKLSWHNVTVSNNAFI